MATVEEPPAIPERDMAAMEQAVRDAMSGARDPEGMDRAAARMDRMREEMRRRVGEGEWAVALTRETRDGG